MRNTPLTRKQLEKLGKGFHANQFANRRTRRTRADKFAQLIKAVEKRAEAKKAFKKSRETPEWKVYWFFRSRVNRLAAKCYPKRATV